MEAQIYKSPKKEICNPIVRQISIALLLTTLLTGVILLIFYPSLELFFIAFFGVIIGGTLLPGTYLLYKSFRSDLKRIHLFAHTQDDKLFYVTIEIPPREVHHARFPENLGFGALNSTVNDVFKETVDFVYSQSFDQSVSQRVLYNEPFRTQKDISVDELCRVDKILPIRGGWVINYYNSKDSDKMRHAIVFKHNVGAIKILEIAEKHTQGDNA